MYCETSTKEVDVRSHYIKNFLELSDLHFDTKEEIISRCKTKGVNYNPLMGHLVLISDLKYIFDNEDLIGRFIIWYHKITERVITI